MSSEPSPAASESDRLSQRVEQLELLVTHLQRELEQFHEVLLDQGAALSRFRSDLTLLDHTVHGLPEASEDRDPLDERPPHY